MFKLGLVWFTGIQGLLLLPLYVCLAPFCMISSSLFDWMVSWLAEEQTLTIMIILVCEWAISALLIF